MDVTGASVFVVGPLAPLRRASLLVGAQAVAIAVIGLGYAVSGVVGEPEDRTATVLAGLIALAAGLLLVLVARGLGAVRGWAWSPAIVAQLFLLVVGGGLVQGRVWWAAAPILLLAGGVLYQLATPEARTAFRGLG